MGNLLSATPKPQPSPLKAAPSLQEQILVLEKRKAHLERLIELQIQKAKQAKTREDGLRYLKLKQNYETELKSIFGMLDKLEGLDNARQRVVLQAETLRVTDHATNVLKSSTVDVDKADDIMSEARDAMDEVNRVSEALGRTDPPSEELEQELNNLLAPAAPATVPVSAAVPEPQPVILNLPEVPTMEKELRMLATS